MVRARVISRFCITGLVPSIVASIVSLGAIAMSLSDDPWPHWQRTATRTGNTNTIGPQTGNIEWSIRFSQLGGEETSEASPVMDAQGRIFVGTKRGVTAIDTISRSVIWEEIPGAGVRGMALWNGCVLWGDGSQFPTIYCYDSDTGKPIWTYTSEGSNFWAPVISSTGIAYFSDGGLELIHARNAEDGSEVWTVRIESSGIFSSPTLDWPNVLASSGGSDVVGQNPINGNITWLYPTNRAIVGAAAIRDGRVYAASTDRYLYCLDQTNGQEIWRFWSERYNRGVVAVGHNGAIYTGTSGVEALLFAVSSDGDEVWRYALNGFLFNSPIVDGNESIYSATMTSSPRRGWVEAVNANGTELWTIEMPDQCAASPMLAPDGTLYIVCVDKNLYAFRDPHLRASITNLEVTTGTILDGGIDEIAEPDGAYLHTRSGFGRQLSELHKTELIINATVTDSQPAIMRIQIESRTDQPSAMAIVQLRNWTTNRFETVRNYEVESEEEFEWIQIPKGGNGEQVNPQRYIRPSGGIEMKLKHIVFVPFLAFTFESFIDQIKIEVTG